jgi:hypothetical protein
MRARLRAHMAGPRLRTAVILVTGTLVSGGPAAAQFGDFPRPPAGIPGRPAYPPPPDARGPVPPPPDYRGSAPPTGAIQSQPLPPPPGTEPADVGAVQRPAQPAAAGQGPERQSRGAPQPTNTGPQPGDTVITALPAEKIANPTAVFSGLDKITGRTIRFEVAINETVQFGALQVTPRVCYTRPPTETPNTDGFVEVDEITLQGETKRIFGGWMFAASPGLHAVEHPIYDVSLVDCKKGAPNIAGAAPSSQAAAAPSQPPPEPAPPGPAPARANAPAQTANPSAPGPRR